LQVFVRENNVDQALRVLKKKIQREGVFREMKRRKAYEKPSERRTREKPEAIRRAPQRRPVNRRNATDSFRLPSSGTIRAVSVGAAEAVLTLVKGGRKARWSVSFCKVSIRNL
jgi:small subunit ribosomal protein S21